MSTTPRLPGTPPDIGGIKQLLTTMHVAFSDIHVAVEDLVAEEDKVVSRFTVRGRYTGDFMGVAPYWEGSYCSANQH